jgi:hypothetical protein
MDRKWFLSERNTIVDLLTYEVFYISDENFEVYAEKFKDSYKARLGVFNNKEDANAYLKEIFNVLEKKLNETE